MSSRRKLLDKKEIIILLSIILIASIVFFYFKINQKKQEGSNIANIYVFSDLYRTVNLDGTIDHEKIIIKGRLEVEIVVEGNQIYFFKSQCPDKVCINAGKLAHAHQSAACLPAEVSILLS